MKFFALLQLWFTMVLISIFFCPQGHICQADEVYRNTVEVSADDKLEDIIYKAAHVVPSQQQLQWQQGEFICFIHFGVNTFTAREWGTGMEEPNIFRPEKLDTDQWCRMMKAAGMTEAILTAKHHDGFCLWQTRYTNHSVASSPWRNGKGDVLRDMVNSCRKHGLKVGIYLSPADLYQIENPDGLYGNLSKYTERTIPRPVPGRPFENKHTFKYPLDDYNEYFMNQLFELLTEYGPIHEVWFDGAHPKRKGGQTYTYAQWYELIRELAPEAVIFGKGPDVRWCGNEAGQTRDAEWNVIPLRVSPDQFDWPDMTDTDLDDDINTCWMAPSGTSEAELVITLKGVKTFNRIMFQEQIKDFGQRIAKYAVDAFIDGQWQQIADGQTVGYKRICRTPPVTTNKIRIRVLECRVCPTINNFGLYYEPELL